MTFYGLPLPHTLVELSAPAPTATSLPDGVKFELQTLPVSNQRMILLWEMTKHFDHYLCVLIVLNSYQVDAKAVADGDTVTVYVSTEHPRESSCIPKEVLNAATQRSQARNAKNYAKADALHKIITDAGYRYMISISTLYIQLDFFNRLLRFEDCFFFLKRVLTVQNEEILARKYRIRLR